MRQNATSLRELQNKRAAAMEIALDAGVLDRCTVHKLVHAGPADIQQGYELAARRWDLDDLEHTFESGEELRDFLDELEQEHKDSRCPLCTAEFERDPEAHRR